MTSNKPYLIRAVYDWIVDNACTPYLLITVEHGGVEVPTSFVQNGKIVFNVSPTACRGLHLGNDRIVFTARFSGESLQVSFVPQAVLAIYAKENGKGMEFPEDPGPYIEQPLTAQPKKRAKPFLSLVKKDKE
ncbi:MAG: ClpXP protease specificity-enhancing factor [Gammaproteobacteria bacterium]|nr:ClpXP protease specificity-enhancing factor [Gammaproteobacteria bacterium]